MAAVVTKINPSAAFLGQGGIRSAGVATEFFLIVLSGGTTAATITTTKITRPTGTNFIDVTDASIFVPTLVITPLGSGTSTIAATVLTADRTYVVMIKGSR